MGENNTDELYPNGKVSEVACPNCHAMLVVRTNRSTGVQECSSLGARTSRAVDTPGRFLETGLRCY